MALTLIPDLMVWYLKNEEVGSGITAGAETDVFKRRAFRFAKLGFWLCSCNPATIFGDFQALRLKTKQNHICSEILCSIIRIDNHLEPQVS